VRTLLLAVLLAGAAPAPVKWFHHDHDKKVLPPLAHAPAPFSIEVVPDPRDGLARMYLEKQRAQLKVDREKYPRLQTQIDAVLEDINGLEADTAANPEFPGRFAAFYASLVELYKMEGWDAI
jgi:hypothetical protein